MGCVFQSMHKHLISEQALSTNDRAQITDTGGRDYGQSALQIIYYCLKINNDMTFATAFTSVRTVEADGHQGETTRGFVSIFVYM